MKIAPFVPASTFSLTLALGLACGGGGSSKPHAFCAMTGEEIATGTCVEIGATAASPAGSTCTCRGDMYIVSDFIDGKVWDPRKSELFTFDEDDDRRVRQMKGSWIFFSAPIDSVDDGCALLPMGRGYKLAVCDPSVTERTGTLTGYAKIDRLNRGVFESWLEVRNIASLIPDDQVSLERTAWVAEATLASTFGGKESPSAEDAAIAIGRLRDLRAVAGNTYAKWSVDRRNLSEKVQAAESKFDAYLAANPWDRLIAVALPPAAFYPASDHAWAISDSECGQAPPEPGANRDSAARFFTDHLYRVPVNAFTSDTTVELRHDTISLTGDSKIKVETNESCTTVCCNIFNGDCNYRIFGCDDYERPRESCRVSVSRSWDTDVSSLTVTLPRPPDGETREAEAVVHITASHQDCGKDAAFGTRYTGEIAGIRVWDKNGVLFETITHDVPMEAVALGPAGYRPRATPAPAPAPAPVPAVAAPAAIDSFAGKANQKCDFDYWVLARHAGGEPLPPVLQSAATGPLSTVPPAGEGELASSFLPVNATLWGAPVSALSVQYMPDSDVLGEATIHFAIPQPELEALMQAQNLPLIAATAEDQQDRPSDLPSPRINAAGSGSKLECY